MARQQHYTYVEPEDSFPSQFICNVCHDVAGTHTACPGCSQTFCQSCVHRWFNTQKSNIQGCTCPYCRRKLKFSDLQHDMAIQQKLDELSVYCPNRSAGCTAQLPRATVAAHLKKDCGLQESSCQHCDLRGLRSAVRVHEETTCPNRTVPCENAAAGCKYEVPLHVMQLHLDLVCELQPQPCRQCGQAIPRRDWLAHLQTACPAQQYCPLRIYGCIYTGTEDEVQQHSCFCSYIAHKQQIQRQLEESSVGGNLAAAAAAANSVTSLDPGELPDNCCLDQYMNFRARTLLSAFALASEKVLNAIPAAALPPKLQPQQHTFARVAVHTVQQLPAALAAQTPPKYAVLPDPAAAAVDLGQGSFTGMSAAEALALSLPGCFELVHLESNPNLETAWRIALNLVAIDVLSSEEGDVELPGTFMLYTSMCRAWNVVHGRYGQLCGSAEQQQQQQQQEVEDSRQQVELAGSNSEEQPQQGNRDRQPGTARRSSGASPSSSGGQNGNQGVNEAESGEPGLERGLTEDEYEQLNSWIVHQHDTVAPVLAAVSSVLQLWLQPGLAVLLPGQVTELQQLLGYVSESLSIMGDIAKPKKQGSSSRHSSGAGTNSQQEQQQQGGGTSGVGSLEDRAAQIAATAAAATPSRAARTASRIPLIRTSSSGSHSRRQGQNKHERDAAADTSSGGIRPCPAMFSTTLQQLQQLAATPQKRQVLKRSTLTVHSKLHALDLYTSILVLHHLRAEHVDISMIPNMPVPLVNGYRGYWGVSILAMAEAHLSSGFRLGWQAVAVLNDMISQLVGRVLQVAGEGFYDAAEGRVPLNPQLAMSVIQLVVPPELVSSVQCLNHLLVLSSRYHDEECDDLTEVTWQQLAARIGLKIELDKLVYMVDERLPVTLEEDEDEDMEEGSTDAGSGSDDDEDYTTDDEDLPRPSAAASADSSSPAAAAAAAIGSGSDSEADWESADSDEVMTLLDLQHEQQQPTLGPAGAGTNNADGSKGSSTGAALASSSKQAGDASPAHQGLQQWDSNELEPAPAAAGGGGGGGGDMDWHQEFEANLRQLASTCVRSPLEYDLVLAQVANCFGPDLAAVFCNAVGEAVDVALADTAEGEGAELSVYQHDPVDGSSDSEAIGAAGSSSSGNSQPAAAAVDAVGGAPANIAIGPQQQQQQQQLEREAKEKEAGDACTHGIVLIAGLVEYVLSQLLDRAVTAAARQAAVTAAAAAGSLSAVAVDIDPEGVDRKDAGAEQQQLQQLSSSGVIHISARHMLLAATTSEDLRSLLIDRPVDQQYHNPAAVAWAGVAPHFNPALLPDPEKEPITAWLLHLAAGNLQQLQQQQRKLHGSSSSSEVSAVLYPADLRFYCGSRWAATVALPGTVDSNVNDRNAHDSSNRRIVADSTGDGAVVQVEAPMSCCFLSGWQCTECVEATEAMAMQSLDYQLSVVHEDLEHLNSACGLATRSSSSSGGVPVMLSCEQLQRLEEMTRMYHLQQSWWYETARRHGIDSSLGSSTTNKADNSNDSSTPAPAHQQMLSAVDSVQLTNVHALVTPLRDVTAIREILIQRQQEGLVWPNHDFDELVEEAIEAVALRKQQQCSLQKRLHHMVVKPAAAAMAYEETPAHDVGLADMLVDDEALTLLATAAEDFIVQQFRSANEFAVHAGRQEVRSEDLRLALICGGYTHMLPTERQKSLSDNQAFGYVKGLFDL